MKKRIYLSSPHMGGKELEFVKETFDTNWIAPVGPHVDAFEKEFCELTGVKYAVALNSGRRMPCGLGQGFTIADL